MRSSRVWPLVNIELPGVAVGSVLLAQIAMASAQTEAVVVATTPDLASITESVSGGSVRVQTLIPPGADPEAFEPRTSQLVLLRRAALVLRVGVGYEHWLDRLLQQSGARRLLPGGEGYIDLSAQIALLEVRGRSVNIVPGHAHGIANPHYWLDPVNVEAISGVIASALVRLSPDRRAQIEAAHAGFVAELKARTAEWIRMLEPYRGAALVSYHNTWPYFARRFRLNIIDVVEPKEGVPPSVARLAGLAAAMRQQQVRALLHEPFQPADTARMLAQRAGARLVLLAPSVGSVPQATGYFDLMEYNVRTLVQALAP